MNKKFLSAAFFSASVVAGIFMLVYITNPGLRSVNEVVKPETKTQKPIVTANRMLAERVILLPGEIVSKWFDIIPEQKPFLYGCGYRFLAPILGCSYVEYQTELYPVFFPDYARRGFKGTVNTASFVYDYANFGKVGLVISGILLSILIFFIENLFEFDLVFNLSLNAFYVFMLSSSALSTLLFSGGWALILLLFFVYKKTDKNF